MTKVITLCQSKDITISKLNKKQNVIQYLTQIETGKNDFCFADF